MNPTAKITLSFAALLAVSGVFGFWVGGSVASLASGLLLASLLAEEHRAVFCARVDPRTSCGPGTPIRLSVDPRRFHFFDPETGQALTTEPAAVATA